MTFEVPLQPKLFYDSMKVIPEAPLLQQAVS